MDSNHGPPDYESGALTNWAIGPCQPNLSSISEETVDLLVEASAKLQLNYPQYKILNHQICLSAAPLLTILPEIITLGLNKTEKSWIQEQLLARSALG